MRPLLFSLLLLASPLNAQTFVLVSATDQVRQFLAERWDDTVDPAQVERAFCATYFLSYGIGGEPFVVLTTIDSAETEATMTLPDGRRGIIAFCPSNKIHVHSHPPSSQNMDGTFSFRGMNGNLCGPSLNDLRHLKRTGAPLAVVHCDRWSLVAYSLTSRWPKVN